MSEPVGRYTNKASLTQKRRKLRKEQTKAEWVLWQKIRDKQFGVKFRRQYSIEFCIADFYCHELRLIIELDGWIHGQEDKRKKDIQRQRYLESLGYHVLRYRNEQIRYELEAVLSHIAWVVQRLQNGLSLPRPHPTLP